MKYLVRWVTCATTTGILEIVKCGETLKRYFGGKVNVIRLDPSKPSTESIKNKIRTTLKSSQELNADEYKGKRCRLFMYLPMLKRAMSYFF